MPAEVDDRRRRLIAFVVITLVFIVSIAALVYWAMNVATARINSRITAHLQVFNPLGAVAGEGAILLSGTLVKSNNSFTAWKAF